MYVRGFLIFCLLGIFSCTSTPVVVVKSEPVDQPLITVDSVKVMSNLRFLSSDELMGREAGTPGERIAADFIRTQLEQSGVQPFAADKNGSTQYFQFFDAIKIAVDPAAKITLYDSTTRRQKRLLFAEYFANFHDQIVPGIGSAPVVFAGYGITAPEFNYDDYAGLDVKGKIVVALDGEPESDDDGFFYGPIASSYNSALFYKRHRAKELGAKAFIVMAYPNLIKEWPNTVGLFRGSRMFFGLETVAAADTGLIPFYYANDSFLESILAKAPYSPADLKALAAQKKPLPRFQIPKLSAELDIRVDIRKTNAINVIGLVEGNDAALKNEYVVVGAHFDHLGINAYREVYNGADDDASGTAAVLEVGRLLAERKLNKRPVILVFHGAEEKGLLGSEYLTGADSPKPFSMEQLVAMINLDMVGRESADSIFVIGSGRLSTELKSINETVNAEHGLFTFDYRFDADDDPNQYYYRSDHYHYAKQGIPVVFFFDGMETDYHKTTDDFEKINYDKLRNTIRHVHELTLRLSNLGHRLTKDPVE